MKKNLLRWIAGAAAALVLALGAALPLASPPRDTTLLESAEQVLRDIVQLRGLELTAPVSKGVKNRDQIRRYLLERIAEEYPPEEIETERKVLVKLGLIPPDLDLHDFMIDLLTEQVAGFYDPKTQTFYIADWIPAEAQKPIMAHELTHALQDQHFNLSQLLDKIEGNDDESMARSAVIEGEGIAVMLDYMLKPFGQNFLSIPDLVTLNRTLLAEGVGDFTVFSAAPLYLRETLIFPYTYGARFLQEFRRRNEWTEVSRLYSDLPTSTEQILHPARYLDQRDPPVPVPDWHPDRLERDRWRQIYSNVLGEFSTYLVLHQFLDEEVARQASEGWGGDRILLLEGPGGKLSVAMRSVWDSERDALEFFEAYRQLIPLKYSEAALEPAGSGDSKQLHFEGDRIEVVLRREGRQVDILETDRPGP